jgi:hypothetical protein
MSQTVQQALAAAQFYTDDQDYALVRLHSRAITAAAGVLAELGGPFAGLIVDKDEITLVLPAFALEELGQRLHDHQMAVQTYRLVTLDVELDPNLTGFMAAISRALSDAGVSLLPYAAYSRDHLLVPADQFDTALDALQKLKQQTTS